MLLRCNPIQVRAQESTSVWPKKKEAATLYKCGSIRNAALTIE